MRVVYEPRSHQEKLLQSFTFLGGKGEGFGRRVERFVQEVTEELPVLKDLSLRIETENTFPHSCGVASSASAFSALALCLCEIQQKEGGAFEGLDFHTRSSFVARLGSGSACRSLFAPFSLWGLWEGFPSSCDEWAVPVFQVHPDFFQLRDSICLVNSDPKEVSSSRGHKLMEDNPFARTRYQTANQRVGQLLSFLEAGELKGFIELAEMESLALHGMIFLSPQPSIMLAPDSLSIIERVRDFQRLHRDIPLGFTIDAGPNIHLLSFERDREVVNPFIEEEIAPLTQGIIEDVLGEGPVNSWF